MIYIYNNILCIFFDINEDKDDENEEAYKMIRRIIKDARMIKIKIMIKLRIIKNEIDKKIMINKDNDN